MSELNQSFVLYTNYYDILADLSNEKLGELFRAILEYKTTKKQPVVSVDLLVVFKFIKNQLDIDEEKYNRKRLKSSENGRKGGAPKGNQNAKKQPKTTQNKHNDNDNDNDNVNVNVNDNDNVNVNVNDNDNVNVNVNIPTKKEIAEYAEYLAKHIDVDMFFEYYGSSNWLDSGGLPINWKQKVIQWANRSTHKPRDVNTGGLF